MRKTESGRRAAKLNVGDGCDPEGRSRIARRFIAGSKREGKPFVPEGRLKMESESRLRSSLRDLKYVLSCPGSRQ